MSTRSWLAFKPRDTVFVRDGRSFDAASDPLAQTVRPSPTTIAGAVGAAFPQNPEEVRGPVLAREGALGWEPYFPAPADLVVTAGETGRVFRLTPQEASGETDLSEAADGFQWLLSPAHAGQVAPLTGWIPGRILAEYLAGRLPASGGTLESQFRVAEPLVPEQRVGLARDGRSARLGYLYQATHWRPHEHWAFLAEITVADTWAAEASDHVPFGGRGRLADVETATATWPTGPEVSRHVLVYLATPAIWPDGWRLPVPAGAKLVAAATGDAEPAGTVKRGPDWRDSRALRWAVPAGSVYLLEFADATAGAEWARKNHGTAYGRDDKDPLRTAGHGVVLTGVWT